MSTDWYILAYSFATLLVVFILAVILLLGSMNK